LHYAHWPLPLGYRGYRGPVQSSPESFATVQEAEVPGRIEMEKLISQRWLGLISPEKVQPRPARIDFAASSIPAYSDHLASVIDRSNVAELAQTHAGF
jgi:hypothetical protein